MADEIIQQLGFNVDEALKALQSLDQALNTTSAAFAGFGAAIDAFNGKGIEALKTLRGLASAASQFAAASQNMAAPAARPAAADSASKLWLPPDTTAEVAAEKAAKALASAGNAGSEAGRKTASAMREAASATDDAKQKGDSLVVSWNTIARVVMTQTVVRAMSMLRDALKDAVTVAEEFQVRLAEIQTISPRIGADLQKGILGTATPLETLEAEVTRFSKMANIPLPQVQAGLYETISDQFTSITDRTNVMTAAMKLSKVAVMDFGDAVTLITGTLNAFGMTSEQSETVAAKFFETIKLGHVHGAELAEVWGQMIPIASELGVNIDELNAAMVAMTIGGMDAHKTATALRGAMTAFLKPSDDMKKVIRGMGFSDPSQLMAAKGFQGALQAIADQADGMGSEIAKSVRNVRALTAELRLSSEVGAQKYKEAMEALKAASPEGLEKILQEFRSTDTDKLQTQINAMKVNLTQGFGQAMVKILGQIMEFMGGADKMSAAITAIAAAAVPCAVALTGLAAAFALVHLSLGPVGIALLAITAVLALTAGAYTYQTMTNIANINKESDARHEATMKMLRDEEQKIAKWKESQEAEARASQGRWVDEAAALRRDYFKALDDLKEKNQEAVASARAVMESMISTQERVVSVYRNAANAAIRAVQESQQRVLTLESQYADARFKYAEKGIDAEMRADDYRRRGLQLAREAASQLASAKTPDQVQAALAAFQRAEAHVKEAESIAQATHNVLLQEDAERAVLTVMNGQIGAEKQLQQLQAQQARKLAEQAAKEQARVNDMKTLMKSILEDLAAFDKQGAKEPKALQEQENRLKENVARFRQLFLGGQRVDVADLLAFDQLQRRVETALAGGVSTVQVRDFEAIPESFAKLRDQIEKGIGPIRVLIERATSMDSELTAEIKGMSAEEAVNHLEKRLIEARQQKINFGALEQQLAAVQKGLRQFQEDAMADLQKWLDVSWQQDVSLEGATAWTDMTKQPLKTAAQRMRDAAAKFTRPGAQVTDKDFLELQAAYENYMKAIRPGPESKAALQKVLERALEVKQQAEAVRKGEEGVQRQITPAIQAEQRIMDIEAALRAAKAAADQTKAGTDGAYQGAQMTAGALQQVAQMDMSGLVGQINMATAAMWGLVMAANAFSPPDMSGMTAAHGGPVQRFASGGAVGVDVVPAMLRPGEFVMNPSSTRKFASQLIAMNAGVRPVFHSEGGSVTNIGDIHVTVQGGGTGRQTARSIAAELRRELRRGTSIL